MRWRGGAMVVTWALGLAALGGCNGCDDPGLEGEGSNGGPNTVVSQCIPAEADCPERESFRDGRCQNTYCDTDDECCPGSACDVNGHLCRSAANDAPCDTDGDCLVPGQVCQQVGTFKVCGFTSCDAAGSCPEGRSCYKGSCVVGSPCPGGCPVDQVCDVATARCHPAAGKPGCAVSCDVGALRVLKDPATMSGEICCALECECAPLPPLPPGLQGQYASVAAGVRDVAVAAYDQTYGDLVVRHYGQLGGLLSTDYVDGFPASGTVGGSPDGPRHGVLEPGDDVGRYAAATADALGRIHVAYYDATNGALRYAVNTEPGQWHTHAVDDTQDAGRFASITIRPSDGAPVLAYLVLGTDGGGRANSEVRVAVANSANPRSTAEWTLLTAEASLQADPCNHACTAGQTCVLGDMGPSCGTDSTACAPACGGAQACVAGGGGGGACQALASPPIAGLPPANGLFTSVSGHGSNVVAAWYDGVTRLLKAVDVDGVMAGAPVVVDGDGMDGRALGDVGQHVSVAHDLNGKVGMVYWDATAHELRFYGGVGLTGGRFHTVDSGRGQPPGFRQLGADASLAAGPDGTFYVAYQEQTNLDLLLAQRNVGDDWEIHSLLEGENNGAVGFFASLAVSGSRAYVANVKAQLDERDQVANVLGLFVRDVPIP